jgi:hypothetical protein
MVQTSESKLWEKSIPAVLAKLGEAADVSRVYVFENSRSDSDRILMSLRYEWVADGIQSQKDSPHFQNLPYEAGGFGRWASILSRNKAILEETKLLPTSKRCGNRFMAVTVVRFPNQF